MLRRTRKASKDVVAAAGMEAKAAAPSGERRPSFCKVTNEEVDAIKQLVKSSEGGTNLVAVRERRRSKEIASGDCGTGVKERRYSKEQIASAQEADGINALIKQAATAGSMGAAIRQRRKSKESTAPMEGTSSVPTLKVAVAPAAAPLSSARRRTRNQSKEFLALVSTEDSARSQPETAEDSGGADFSVPTSQLASHLQRYSQGPAIDDRSAAARGARAADLARVKKAATEIGGKFLTIDEWEAMQAEMKMLRVKNARLTEQLAGKVSAPATEDDAGLRNPLSYLSKAIGNSLSAVGSPLGQRASSLYNYTVPSVLSPSKGVVEVVTQESSPV